MDDILQKMIGIKIEQYIGIEEMKINIEGVDDNYYVKLDEIIINPKIVDFHNIEIKKNSIKMDFEAPLICNKDNINISKSIMIGVKLEGKDKNIFNEKVEEIAKNFGPDWEEAVRKRKESILERDAKTRKYLF